MPLRFKYPTWFAPGTPISAIFLKCKKVESLVWLIWVECPCGSAGKESACKVGDLGSIPVGKIPWRRERLPTPVFWRIFVRATVHGVAMSQTRLSDFHFHWKSGSQIFRLSLCKQTCHSSRGLLYSTGNYSQHLVLFLVAQSCPILCDPMVCSPPGYSVHGDSPTQSNPLEWVAMPSSRVSRYQGSNPGLPHCRWILCHLSHQGSPRILEWVAYPFLQGIFPTQESKQRLLHCWQILYQLPGKPQYLIITYNGK